MRYNILYEGKTRDDIENPIIVQNLTHLYDADEESIIRQFFLSTHHVLIENVTQIDAEAYQQALYEAGIITVLKPYVEPNSINFTAETQPKSESAIHQSAPILKGDDLFQHLNKELHTQRQNSTRNFQDRSTTVIDEHVQPSVDTLNLSLIRHDDPQESSNHRRVGRTASHKRASTSKKREKIDPGYSLSYILSPQVRANRLQYIIRLFAALALLIFTDHFVNLFLLKISKMMNFDSKSIILISLFLLFMVGSLLIVFTVQRLHDLGKGASYVIILILPITLIIASQFSGRFDHMRIQEMQDIQDKILQSGFQKQLEKSDLHKVYIDSIEHIAKLEGEESARYNAIMEQGNPAKMSLREMTDLTLYTIRHRIDSIKENTFNHRYRYIFIFCYITSTILILALFLMKGTQGVNAYGAHQPSELSKSMIVSISAIIGVFLITLIFIFFTGSYDNLRQEYDQMFFETMGFEKTI